MTVQTINIGNVVNDGLGDDLRTAFQKVNANFVALEASLTVTASNASESAGQGIFKDKVGSELIFRNLISGRGISLEGFTNAIRINNTQPAAFLRLTTEDGNSIRSENSTEINIIGGDNIAVTSAGNTITIDSVFNPLASFDFGPIKSNYENSLQLALAASNVDFGTITKPGDFYLDLGIISGENDDSTLVNNGG